MLTNHGRFLDLKLQPIHLGGGIIIVSRTRKKAIDCNQIVSLFYHLVIKQFVLYQKSINFLYASHSLLDIR